MYNISYISYITIKTIIMDNLEDRVLKLENTIAILKDTLKEIVSNPTIKDILTNNSHSDLTTTKNTNKDKVPKDRILIQALLERATQDFHVKFLTNILNNKYDTLTDKQYSVLVNIQNSI